MDLRIKITYENGLIYEGDLKKESEFYRAVSFNKPGKYGGVVFDSRHRTTMFSVSKERGNLFVDMAFGSISSFSCTYEDLISRLTSHVAVDP